MAGHEKRDERAQRLMSGVLSAMGRELRTARLGLDLSQTDAGRAIGVSPSTWSRIERGAVPNLALLELGRALAVVGLDLHVRAYPGGRPLRDEAHLRLLERLHCRLGAGARWRTEVPLPLAGDRRAWDALIVVGAVSIGIEAETRRRVAGYVDQAAQEGLSPAGLAKLIEQDASGAFGKARALVIARTETGTAYNLASLEGYRASERVEHVQIFDADECGWTEHDDPDLADGTVRTLDEAEECPLSHPNCVRAWAPVVETGGKP